MIEDIFIAYPYFLSVVCSVLLVDKYRAKLHQQNNDNRGHFICFFSTWMEKLFYVNWMMSSPHLPHTFLSFLLFFCSFKAPIFCIFYNTHKYAYVHICMYTYVHTIHIQVDMCVYVHIHTHVYANVYVCMYIHMWICGCVSLCVSPENHCSV